VSNLVDEANMHVHFWHTLDALVTECKLVIDRPRGTPHPRYPSFIYPLDYGYLEGTRSGDGGGIDIWIGSLAGKVVTAAILCVDLEKQDAEMKVLLGCTLHEVQQILAVHNSGGQAGILLERT
jgi:inorganic pyrophosphatase